jgi:HD-GYP domain-containing protein (c-di-GMP phosphodiesterase class II)
MIDNIHSWLLIRLAIVWLVLSLVSGGLVHYLGHAQLDDHIVQMAKAETSAYTAEFVGYLKSPSEQALALFKQRTHAMIAKDNLVVIRFYAMDKNEIFEVAKSIAKETEDKLPLQKIAFSHNDSIISEKLDLDGETYLRVHFPVNAGTDSRVGYLAGIYHAPSEIINQMRQQSFWSLILVVLAIFMTSFALYPLIIRLNNKLKNHAHILALTNIGMLKVLGSAIAKRDSDTNSHNYRVTLYAVRLGEKLGIANAAMQGLIKGAFLHDVGKIAITDTILLKPGKLTGEEFEIMKTHVNHGVDIVCGYAWLKDAEDIVRCHHERFDGSGYPCRMMGEDIPENARIFAIVDVFDAITSRRPYKEPFSFEVSLKIIENSQGSHFDPAIVRLFLVNAEKLYEEICTEDEASLLTKLEGCISCYFNE